MFSLLLGAALAAKVTVPIDVGVGPALLVPNGALYGAQPGYGAIALSGEAVIDKETLRKNKKKIPKQYRQMMKGVEEIRISKPYIPHMLYLSPPVQDSWMLGGSFQPVSLGTSLVSRPKLSWDLDAGLLLTYAYITQPALYDGGMHFLRPGLALRTEVERELTDTFLISFGWESQLYVPQGLGDSPFALPSDLSSSLWHLGGPFLKLHFRFPYTVKI